MFGYPTGLGALLVKNSSETILKKQYYGGGTVLVALSSQNGYIPRPLIHERFEDGTLNFLSIISLNHGFSNLYKLVDNMDNVARHCFELAKYAFGLLLRLHHSNGMPAVHLYTDTAYDDIETQGNIVNFNMLRANGDFIGFAEVLSMANLHGIQLRTGCFCNPGACRRHLGLSIADVKNHYQSGHVCGDDMDLVNGQPTGSVRISFGYYSIKEDVDRLIYVLTKCFISTPVVSKIPVIWSFTETNLKNKFRSKNNTLDPNKKLEKMRCIYFWYENVGHFSPIDNLQCTQSDMYENLEEVKINSNKPTSAHISHIFLYPIKSCGRMTVDKWILDSKGLQYDRMWMIVNSSGVALTQKKEPRMCMIKPIIDATAGKLHLTCDGFGDISVNLIYEEETKLTEGSFCQSKVCGDRIKGIDCGDEVANWLVEVLNIQGLRLIQQLPADSRINKRSSGKLSLSNQGQYLLISSTSVDWLTELLDPNSDCTKDSMLNRFRSNFIATGVSEKFEEQTWKEIVIGKTLFTVDGPCGRCQMICIDQDTGERTKEPLTTLAASMQGKMKFGIYLSKVENEDCVISVGDSLQVIK